MYGENFISAENAKLLKKKGFDDWCRYCYTVGVYNQDGIPLTFDEECELKDAGREDEIVHIDGGFLTEMAFNNNPSEKACSAPTQDQVRWWLLRKHSLNIVLDAYPHEDGCFYWAYKVLFLNSKDLCAEVMDRKAGFDKPEDAYESALTYCIENIIK